MGIDIRRTCNIFTITFEHCKVLQPGGGSSVVECLTRD